MKVRLGVLLALPLAVFAAFAALFFVGLRSGDDGGLTSALISRAAPDLSPARLGDSPPPTNADIRAPGVKLVNFWASWCAPCRVEHPNLQDLADQGIVILGVNYKDKPGHALDFLNELGSPFEKIGADNDGRIAINWGVYGVPETFVIDGSGVVRLRWAGPVTSRALANHIMPVLNTVAPK